MKPVIFLTKKEKQRRNNYGSTDLAEVSIATICTKQLGPAVKHAVTYGARAYYSRVKRRYV